MGTISDLLMMVELAAQREIDLRLRSLVTLADGAYSLLDHAMDAVGEYPRSGATTVAATKVCAILAARLANDLRACSIVSRLGYGLQAMGLAATMAEVVGALSYVGDNEARAHEWAKHTGRKETYPTRVKDGIDAFVGALDMTESAASAVRDQWQRIYASLCMAKHANPLLSREQGLRVLPDGAYFVRGPDASQLGAKNSCYALVHGVGFGSAGTYVFAKRCHDEGLRAQLQNDALKIWGQLRDLEETVLVDPMTPPPTEPA